MDWDRVSEESPFPSWTRWSTKVICRRPSPSTTALRGTFGEYQGDSLLPQIWHGTISPQRDLPQSVYLFFLSADLLKWSLGAFLISFNKIYNILLCSAEKFTCRSYYFCSSTFITHMSTFITHMSYPVSYHIVFKCYSFARLFYLLSLCPKTENGGGSEENLKEFGINHRL